MLKAKEWAARHTAVFLLLALAPVYAEFTANREVWETGETIDDFTDEKNVFALIISTGKNDRGLLTLSCDQSKSFSVAIVIGFHLGAKRILRAKRINVKYRVDKNDPVTSTMWADHWGDSSKGKDLQGTVIGFKDDVVSRFVRDLMNGKETVLISLTPPDNYTLESHRLRFTLNGAAAAIKTVLEACGKK